MQDMQTCRHADMQDMQTCRTCRTHRTRTYRAQCPHTSLQLLGRLWILPQQRLHGRLHGGRVYAAATAAAAAAAAAAGHTMERWLKRKWRRGAWNVPLRRGGEVCARGGQLTNPTRSQSHRTGPQRSPLANKKGTEHRVMEGQSSHEPGGASKDRSHALSSSKGLFAKKLHQP